MPSKPNSMKLNALQLRTLTILQALAKLPGAFVAGPNAGEVTVTQLPQAHGDHFHIGDAVVSGADTTGVHNEAVWNALTRKGLARAEWPRRMTLTKAGLEYDTGMAEQILHRHTH
jgi:hypothetical protein